MIRLRSIRRGRGVAARVMGPVLGVLYGGSVPGFVQVLMFRPAFFGKPLGRYADAVLRGPGRWTVGERELFGATVSAANVCSYCIGVHARIAADCLGDPVVDALVHRTAEPPDGTGSALPAMAEFLRRLSRDPDALTAADLAPLRAVGIGDDAVREAAHAAALLEICNRVASALGVEGMGPQGNARAAAMLLRRGYDL
ncbi:peroxidase-related enzyme [Actinomycetospora sp. TBRC 11914]|uniref:peroxidase-related enzyme n=1 Tax=Actinomycetospora sp. TBRC 11914 TaxID=2729387 RepID=UPI00145EA4C3|nr:peroxidase-related enzyme [Actinomycetospora sp. TBRC 11914]NMO93545.1 peroxidase-related enzyme [Actinomycetospora sp. TBRC 11914]